jgi:hypothetical protein
VIQPRAVGGFRDLASVCEPVARDDDTPEAADLVAAYHFSPVVSIEHAEDFAAEGAGLFWHRHNLRPARLARFGC